MLKRGILLLLVLTIVFLSACGSKKEQTSVANEETESPIDNISEETTETQTEASAEEEKSLKRFYYT